MAVTLLKTRTAYSRIGLDVGYSAVRAAQLHRSGGRWSVRTLGSWKPPRGSGDIPGNPELVARAADWLRRLEFRGRIAVAGLSPPDVELHAMELPRNVEKSDGDPLRQAARWETERLMGFKEGEAETAYWSLPESRNMASNAIGVAAARSRLDLVLLLCRRAGLDCEQIDATSCAMARFASLLRPAAKEDDVWGVLDLGARLSRLILCVSDTPVLARVFEYGGISWTAKLSESLSVGAEAAEQHKCDQGIAKVRRESGETSGALGEMIYNILRTDIDAIVAEIERSYRYVLQGYMGRRPGPLYLTGGGAAMKGIDVVLSEKIGVEVIVPSPRHCEESGRLDVGTMRSQLREPLANFGCAIGLAVAAD